jgi:Cu(I)/Ag(I) efflux system membrane protein CusA/SilA
MLLYLDLAYEDAKARDRLRTVAELREAIVYGAAKRLRPKFMTFATTCIGLLPVLWSIGTGSEVMKRIAAPMVGGIFTSFLLELLVYPVVYELWRRNSITKPFTYSESLTLDDRRARPELGVEVFAAQD